MATCALILAAPGGAITGGTFDGNAHPYVAYAYNGTASCSGTLLSPTVLLTAAHCFAGMPSAYGTNSVTNAPIVLLSFDANLVNTPKPDRSFFFGSFYPDPAFNPNLPNNTHDPDSHDVALVVLTAAGCTPPPSLKGSCGPVPSSASLGQYGSLPSSGVVDTLAMNTPIDVAGFGVQAFTRGNGKPEIAAAFTRFSATAALIASNDQSSGRFIKLHQNQGGVCFGDSGGPNLLGGTHTVLAVNSFVSNDLCTGVAYSYRVDTPSALGWITSTAAKYGASL